MIVDCYTHTWESADQLGQCLPPHGALAGPQARPESLSAGTSRHQAASEPVEVTFVLGFKSRYLEAEIPNDWIASYVRREPNRFLGVAGIDPSEPREAIVELRRARDELSMPAIAVAPAAQDFHPADSKAMLVYAEAADRGMPIIFHSGVFLCSVAKLEYARPFLLDEVARELPGLKIVIAHMGYPWISETIELLAKHRNVFAETSGLMRPAAGGWQTYQALLSAYQAGVVDKLLFGSGFPAAAASGCIESLYSINHLVHGTNLPMIPREQIRGIVERDAIAALGIPWSRPVPALQPVAGPSEEEPDELA